MTEERTVSNERHPSGYFVTKEDLNDLVVFFADVAEGKKTKVLMAKEAGPLHDRTLAWISESEMQEAPTDPDLGKSISFREIDGTRRYLVWNANPSMGMSKAYEPDPGRPDVYKNMRSTLQERDQFVIALAEIMGTTPDLNLILGFTSGMKEMFDALMILPNKQAVVIALRRVLELRSIIANTEGIVDKFLDLYERIDFENINDDAQAADLMRLRDSAAAARVVMASSANV